MSTIYDDVANRARRCELADLPSSPENDAELSQLTDEFDAHHPAATFDFIGLS